MINKVFVEGRLTRNLEAKQTQSGKAYVIFTVACNRNYKNSHGEYPADFINCVAWGKTAEYMARYFHKGSYILCAGELQNNDYTDGHGVEHYSYRVNVDFVSSCGHFINKDGKKAIEGADSGAEGSIPEGFYEDHEAGEDVPF